jgi:hypothetical protein
MPNAEGAAMAVPKKHLLVTIDDASQAKIGKVVAKLKKAGLTNIQHMKSIGIVSGEAAPEKIETLRKVSGVAAVEESSWIQLPPPDAPIQ